MLILVPVSTAVPGAGAVVEGFSFVVAEVFSSIVDVVIVDGGAVAFPSAKTA